MGLVADTGALLALYDVSEANHGAAAEVLRREREPIFIPSVILAEVDYLLREHLGFAAEVAFLDSLIRGAFLIEPLTQDDLVRCRQIVLKYRNLDLGLADAAVMATAERLEIHRIFTLDRRHFEIVRDRRGRPFEILP